MAASLHALLNPAIGLVRARPLCGAVDHPGHPPPRSCRFAQHEWPGIASDFLGTPGALHPQPDQAGQPNDQHGQAAGLGSGSGEHRHAAKRAQRVD